MCDGPGPLTDEHVISKTVRKQVPAIGKIRQVFAGQIGRQMNVVHMVLTRAVCETCNGGWMRELEDDLVLNLGPQMSSARYVCLNPLQQERTATWAVKTALLFETYASIKNIGAYVPTDNLCWLAEHHSPPPGCSVRLATVDIGTGLPFWSRAGTVADSVGNPGLPA